MGAAKRALGRTPRPLAQGGDAAEIAEQAQAFRSTFRAAQDAIGSEAFPWYPYDSLANFTLLDQTLTAPFRSIRELIGDRPMLDIGCADGATSFFLESLGVDVEAIDFPPTNYNGMQGIRALAEHFRSKIKIHSVDLDTQFQLPRADYGIVLFLGILYHLKNPYFVMEQIARSTRYCFVSTRIAKLNPAKTHAIEDLPVAYLVGPQETNYDATNYWIFSKTGLQRLFDRTGWEVCSWKHFGNLKDSDPATTKGDERVFCLLKSKALR